MCHRFHLYSISTLSGIQRGVNPNVSGLASVAMAFFRVAFRDSATAASVGVGGLA
jgi:hypothetical protein